MKNTLLTALATPYKNGKVDYFSLQKIVEFQSQNDVDGLVCLGTTGENEFLSQTEKRTIVQIAKSIFKLPIFVGICGNSTVTAVQNAIFAQSIDADGLLVSPPSFVKTTAEGYQKHVEEIAKNVQIPLVLYNAPSRTNYYLPMQSVANLAQNDCVKYVKDAGEDLQYTARLSKHVKVLCGCDGLLPTSIKVGSCGVVSVVSNFAPTLTRQILDGNNADVALFENLARLSMLEVNPIATKYLLHKLGFFDSFEMRLPLTSANIDTQKQIDKLLKDKSIASKIR